MSLIKKNHKELKNLIENGAETNLIVNKLLNNLDILKKEFSSDEFVVDYVNRLIHNLKLDGEMWRSAYITYRKFYKSMFV